MRILFALLVAVIAGCKQAPELPSVMSPYKIDIQQGNVVTQEMVGKLKAGMTRAQVRYVLGSPLVADAFHPDRWDYVYLLQRQGKANDRRRITVIFQDEKLARIEGDVVPVDGTQETEKPAPKPPVRAAPATKPEPVKPAEKPPVAATPAAKPQATVAGKPPVAATPAAMPDATVAAQPAAPKAEATQPDAAVGAPPPADAAKSESAKRDAKPDAKPAGTQKTDTAKADEKKEKPKERGFFGRMLDRIGF